MQSNNSTREGSTQHRYSLWNAAYITMIVMTILSVAVVTPILFARSDMYRLLLVILILLPLAWMIPLTFLVRSARNEVGTAREVSHLVLAICCTLFCGVIPGVLAIIATSMFIPRETRLGDFPAEN